MTIHDAKRNGGQPVDAITFASPEYAHGITGIIKNALDKLRLSRSHHPLNDVCQYVLLVYYISHVDFLHLVDGGLNDDLIKYSMIYPVKFIMTQNGTILFAMERLAAMMTFAKVVETKIFSAAARALSTSKSLVSKQVSNLENELCVRLL